MIDYDVKVITRWGGKERAMPIDQKALLVWQCHHFLSRLPANGHLPLVSRQSGLLTNDKGDNEVKPGAMHQSPG